MRRTVIRIAKLAAAAVLGVALAFGGAAASQADTETTSAPDVPHGPTWPWG